MDNATPTQEANDNDCAFTVDFSPEELYFLLGLAGARQVVGMEDPFWDAGADVISERLEAAQKDLARRGFIEEQADGVLLDSTVYSIVFAAANAGLMLTLANETRGERRERVVYLARDHIVEQQVQPDDRVTLAAVRDVPCLTSRTREFIQLPKTEFMASSVISLPPTGLKRASEEAFKAGAVAAQAVLNELALPESASGRLAQVLANESVFGSILAINRDTGLVEHDLCMAWLAGVQGAWWIEAHGEDDQRPVNLVPAKSDEIGARLSEMLRRAMERAPATLMQVG